ncbi:MAG: hypothetical protein AAGA54_19710 [Myxococcota bacterium]
MRLLLVCAAAVLTACPSAEPPASKPDAKKSASKADAKAEATADTPKPEPKSDAPKPEPKPDAPKPEPKPDGPMATLSSDVKFPLADMLGKTPQEIQPKLGEPTGKGMVRESCVRYLPDRTWFDCKYVMQRYEDPTRTYKALSFVYEDGISAGMAIEGIPGEGTFDPGAALAHVGVTLPNPPKEAAPADNVKLWTWFNGSARLVVGGSQYRVEVSSVDGKWETSKVEFINNHPLTKAQQAKKRAPASGG